MQNIPSSDNRVIRGNFLFVSNIILDISNPIPVEIGSLPTQDVLDVQGTRLVGRGTQYLYVGLDNYKVVDITDPANPITKANVYDFPDVVFPKGQLAGNGNFLLASEGLGGIATFDVGALGGQFDKSRTGVFPDGFIFDHTINQQFMYVAGASALGSGGLAILDLSSGAPTFSGILLYGQNEGFAVQVAGTHAFLGLTNSLKTVDVSNPANPVETASQPFPTSALALSGNTLFLGTGDSRLVVLDVTNPNAPVTLASVTIAGPPVTMRLVGNILFLADGPKGMLVFDVSNPARPRQLSQFTVNPAIWDIAVSGSTALLAADSAGLVIANVSNPSQVQKISQTTLESYNPFPAQFDEGPRSVAFSVAINNGIAYVGTANSLGLVFGFDYSSPAIPRLISMTAYGEFIDLAISGLSFAGNDIYVVGQLGVENGIVQAENSDPRNAITLYYPPLALRSITFAAQSGHQSAANLQHPKLDRTFLQSLHERNLKHRIKSSP